MIIRTYSEMILLDSFEERFDYLKLDGSVGVSTFGFDRYLNQALYRSPEWKKTRQLVILRDNGCDLSMPGYEIYDKRRIIIHHMNPISVEQIEKRDPDIFNPEYLITTVLRTHNALHYGDAEQVAYNNFERSSNDTCPWKQ